MKNIKNVLFRDCNGIGVEDFVADVAFGSGDSISPAATGFSGVDIDDGHVGPGLQEVLGRRRISCGSWCWTCCAGGEEAAEGGEGSEFCEEMHVGL